MSTKLMKLLVDRKSYVSAGRKDWSEEVSEPEQLKLK
jgi:hypothetical protein